MKRCYTLCMLVAVLLLMGMPAHAVEPDEILKDPKLEQRARQISTGLRCLVCQNQSIDDSNAPLAKDLRILVRERLTMGESNDEVVDFIVARYGEFVLLRPRFALHTLALWFGTPLLFLIAIWFMFLSYKRRIQDAAAVPAAKLTAGEKRKLKKLLQD